MNGIRYQGGFDIFLMSSHRIFFLRRISIVRINHILFLYPKKENLRKKFINEDFKRAESKYLLSVCGTFCITLREHDKKL